MKKNFLILFLLFIACKGGNKNLNPPQTIQGNDSLVQIKVESIPLEFISKIPDFELPLGNIYLLKTIFPSKFGLPLETDEDGAYLNLKSDVFTKKIQSITDTWKKISNTDGFNYTLTIEDSLKYSMYSNFGKQVVRENYEFIGKIKNKDFIILLGKHTSDNALNSYNFINIVTVSVDGVIIDDLILYKQEFDYVSSYSTYSFMDNQMIVSSKNFFAIEGEYSCEKKERHKIAYDGKFIRYYDKNGNYKNEIEEGLVENNTREGPWVEKKMNTYVNDFTYLEAHFEDGKPVGEWSYFVLKYKRNSEGQADLSIATKGALLYTEMYKDGEMIKRDLVND